MGIPVQQRTRDDLVSMLKCAIKLEHATIPPYLSAMWSIQDQNHDAYDILNSIVLEEMGHMGTACNLLTTIGEKPEMTAKDFVPQYPSPLPCDIVPRVVPPNLKEWKVGLSRLTPAVVSDIFMIIEYPESGPIALDTWQIRKFYTIGEFYDSVAKTLEYLVTQKVVKITGDRQITDKKVGVTPIDTLKKVLDDIKLIKEQGEGTPQGPGAPVSGNELAHYYKFKQIQVGRMYKYDKATKTWSLSGKFFDFPAVIPMADIPPGGYSGRVVPQKVLDLLFKFNQAYGSILKGLQSAWEKGDAGGGKADLKKAKTTMGHLGQTAIELMKIHLDEKNPDLGNYGPTFQPS